MLRFPFFSARTAALAALAAKYGLRMEKDDDDDEPGEDDTEHAPGGKSRDELREAVDRLVRKKGGDPNAVALMLLDENRDLRDQRRVLRQKVAERGKLVPKDGQVVISKEDHAEFEKFKALGKADEVKTKLEKASTLEKESALRTSDDRAIEAARLAGLPNGKLLAKLARPDRENLVIELRDEMKDGKTVKVPFARANKDGAGFKPLAEFAKTDLAEYFASLSDKAAGGESAGSSQGTQGTQQQGSTSFVPFTVPQGASSGTAPGGDKVQAFIDRRNKQAAEKPNPLAPKPQAKT